MKWYLMEFNDGLYVISFNGNLGELKKYLENKKKLNMYGYLSGREIFEPFSYPEDVEILHYKQ